MNRSSHAQELVTPLTSDQTGIQSNTARRSIGPFHYLRAEAPGLPHRDFRVILQLVIRLRLSSICLKNPGLVVLSLVSRLRCFCVEWLVA